jgi:hypothetical protein
VGQEELARVHALPLLVVEPVLQGHYSKAAETLQLKGYSSTSTGTLLYSGKLLLYSYKNIAIQLQGYCSTCAGTFLYSCRDIILRLQTHYFTPARILFYSYRDITLVLDTISRTSEFECKWC